jgi:hypothetical protein
MWRSWRRLSAWVVREGRSRPAAHLVLLVVAVDALEGVEPAPLPLAVLAPGEVAGDGVEPRRELRDAPVAVAVPVDAEERLLKEVLALPAVPDEPVDVVRQGLAVPADEDVEGLDRPHLELLHEVLVGHLSGKAWTESWR